MKNVKDLSLYRLERELNDIADCMGIDRNTFKGIICDLYLRGYKDAELGKVRLRNRLIKLKDTLQNEDK